MERMLEAKRKLWKDTYLKKKAYLQLIHNPTATDAQIKIDGIAIDKRSCRGSSM